MFLIKSKKKFLYPIILLDADVCPVCNSDNLSTITKIMGRSLYYVGKVRCLNCGMRYKIALRPEVISGIITGSDGG